MKEKIKQLYNRAFLSIEKPILISIFLFLIYVTLLLVSVNFLNIQPY